MRLHLLSISQSSFFSAEEYFTCCQTNFFWACALAIASVLFSNYYYYYSYLQFLFLGNNVQMFTVINDIRR